MTAEELRRTYQDRLIRLRDRLKAVKRNQELIMDEISEISQKVALSDQMDKGMQRRTLNAELDQHKVTRELQGSTNEFTDIIDGMRANKLYDEQDYEMWGELNAVVASLAHDLSPKLAEDIYALRKEKPEGGYEGAFDLIYKKQAELVAKLNIIIRAMERISDFNEVIRRFRELLQIEKDLRDAVGKKLKKSGDEKKEDDDEKKEEEKENNR